MLEKPLRICIELPFNRDLVVRHAHVHMHAVHVQYICICMCACGWKPIVQATCMQYARHKDFKGLPFDDDFVLFKLRVFLDVVMVVRVNVCGRDCQDCPAGVDADDRKASIA